MTLLGAVGRSGCLQGLRLVWLPHGRALVHSLTHIHMVIRVTCPPERNIPPPGIHSSTALAHTVYPQSTAVILLAGASGSCQRPLRSRHGTTASRAWVPHHQPGTTGSSPPQQQAPPSPRPVAPAITICMMLSGTAGPVSCLIQLIQLIQLLSLSQFFPALHSPYAFSCLHLSYAFPRLSSTPTTQLPPLALVTLLAVSSCGARDAPDAGAGCGSWWTQYGSAATPRRVWTPWAGYSMASGSRSASDVTGPRPVKTA